MVYCRVRAYASHMTQDKSAVSSPAVTAQATIGGILRDLGNLHKALPRIDPSRAQISACVLDRLCDELAEAADDLRKVL